MPSPHEDLTCRFELQLPGGDGWVPITADLCPDLATLDMFCIWKKADEAAADALQEALVGLVDAGDPLGMTGARILVWEGVAADGAPACVLEATADQLAMGRLERVNLQVQQALREVEQARTLVRVEIIKAAIENRLSRNTIARLTAGALTRRLVLQLLAGYDLVEGIRDALPSCGDQYRRWDPPIGTGAGNEEYLGPYYYGPLQLVLEPNGQVFLSLIDVDSPADRDPLLSDDEYDEEADRAYLQGRADRARGYAEDAWPLLTSAGFALHRPDGAAASVGDLAQTIAGSRLSVTDG